MVDTPEDIDRLESWFEEAIAREALDVAEIKRLTLLSDEESLLALLLRTWGTGTKSSTAWYPQVQQQPHGMQVQRQHEKNQEPREEQGEQYQQQQHQHHAESKTSDEAAAELARRSLGSKPTPGTPEKPSKLTTSDRDDSDTDGPGVAPLTTENCGKVVREAWIWLEFDEQLIPGVMPSMSAAQVDTAVTDIGPGSGPKSFRALLLGGGSVGGGRGGLEHEDTLRLVLLLLQLSSTRSEVTFAHPDSSVVEAVRSVTSGCANELGIATDGHIQLDFMYSTPADSIRTVASGIKRFDYVDIGGPLSSRGGGNSENARSPATGAGVTVLNPETLTLLGRSLAPGAHLRAWAFANNPSTELAFHVAAPAPRDRSRQAVETPTSFVEGTSASRAADTLLLGKILTTTFEVGQNGALVAQSVGGGSALQALTGIEADAEEAWVRQVLAGGDRLSIPDVAQVLADGGFELTPMRAIERREVTASSFSRLREMEEELQEEGLSRWDVADWADSLKVTPTLVHQVFAVWRGDDPSVASSQTV